MMALDKSGNGLHFVQPDAARRPVLRQDATGKRYLEFDGATTALATGRQIDYGTFVGSVYGTALQGPIGLGAVKNAAGDIVMRWAGRAGRDHYFHRNISAIDMTVLTEQVVTGTEFNFTYAAQVAAYGYDARFASFELYEYDASRGRSARGWHGAVIRRALRSRTAAWPRKRPTVTSP